MVELLSLHFLDLLLSEILNFFVFQTNLNRIFNYFK
jgi:hypothetical protein